MQTFLLSLTMIACTLAALALPGRSLSRISPAADLTKTNQAAAPLLADAPLGEATDKPSGSKASTETNTRTKTAGLAEIARATLLNHFLPDRERKSLDELAGEYRLVPDYKKARGTFVTLSKQGRTRACWGSLEPLHSDLVMATIYTTENAINREYRFPPVKENEIDSLKVQVTVVESTEPLAGLRDLNPLRDGLLVRRGGRGGVVLPGEASDPHYQMVIGKLKAGIPANEQCELYKLTSHVYK